MNIVTCVGCGSHAPQPAAWRGWADREGGLAGGQECTRASAALDRLGVPRIEAPSRCLCVRVLNSDRPCAYAWPDGTLFVTEGLLRLLDNEELTGALAHEVGHLAGPAHLKSAAFSGNGAAECEVHADAVGCELLRSAGLSTEFLARALIKVRDAPRTPASLRPTLTQRVQIIQSLPSCRPQ
jgi:Zn-dependent protease with chaperone function